MPDTERRPDKQITPSLLPLLTAPLMLLIALLPLGWIIRLGISSSVIAWGAFAWLASVMLKFAWALPMNQRILSRLSRALPSRWAGPASWSYIGLLTGVFECGFIALLVLQTRSLRTASWQEALAFGISFGSTEAGVLGLHLLIWDIRRYLRPGNISEEEARHWEPSVNTLFGLPIPAVERAAATIIHLITSLLIFQGIRHGSVLYFLLSFLFKSSVDAYAGWLHLEQQITSVTDSRTLWKFELPFIILGIISIPIIGLIRFSW